MQYSSVYPPKLWSGTLISRPFRETCGTREDALESPHLFNAYIDDLRDGLEAEHPNLCRLMGCMIAVLLIALTICNLWHE